MHSAVKPGRQVAPPFFHGERTDRVAQVEGRLHRPAGVVLAWLGVTEDRKHPVAADLGDVSLVRRHDTLVDELQAVEQVAIVFRLNSSRNPRRIGKVSEEDRHRPALRHFARRWIARRRRRHCSPQVKTVMHQLPRCSHNLLYRSHGQVESYAGTTMSGRSRFETVGAKKR